MEAAPAPYVRTRLSVMMFLQYATWGAWLPILWSYLNGHLKFTGTQIGYCFSAGAIGAILGPFLAGQLADRSFATQKLLGISHIVGAAIILAMGMTGEFKYFVALAALYGLVYAPTMALTNSLAFTHLPEPRHRLRARASLGNDRLDRRRHRGRSDPVPFPHAGRSG